MNLDMFIFVSIMSCTHVRKKHTYIFLKKNFLHFFHSFYNGISTHKYKYKNKMPVDLIIFFSPLPPRQFMDLGDKAKESFFILLFILILNFQGESTMFQQVLICFPQVIICSKIMTMSHSQVTFMIQTNMTHGQAT